MNMVILTVFAISFIINGYKLEEPDKETYKAKSRGIQSFQAVSSRNEHDKSEKRL